MIVPIRFMSKEEQELLNRRIKEKGYKGLVSHFIGLGWSLESSIILAKAMMKGVNENE